MTPREAQSAFDIKTFLESLTQRPGVYRMLDAQGEVIYVGKARNLKKRVSSYVIHKDKSPKQQAMMARVASIEVTVTRTEGEALLLESQLIKRYKPRYNITLRDDKSYPYIYISAHPVFPRLSFYRGGKRTQGQLFGPYPSASAVRASLKLLQKIFPVRQCQDSFFQNRTRPCLQYQIKRCTAPCVGLVTPEAYRQDVEDTRLFLEGNGNQLINALARRMEAASADLQFEKAARYRDQIAALRTVLAKQFVDGEQGDVDLVACALKGSVACVQVFFIRNGQQLGDKTVFPQMPDAYDANAVLAAFIPQYYLGKRIPNEILITHEIEDAALLEEVLSVQAKHAVKISARVRGERAHLLQMALTNAENALKTKLANREDLGARLLDLGQELGCDEPPKRLECFDISHSQGELTVASCVVFDQQGPVKSAYRRFNIEGITPGDDYAALAQAVRRRYQRVKNGEYPTPDILFIDGGKGQVRAAREALMELGINDILTIGVAKGFDRKPGMETLVLKDGSSRNLQPSSPALLLIQQLRDEAHRFAITGHRQRRAKAVKQSALESISGLGPKRRQKLLKQFGGLRQISKAGVDELCAVEGISRQLAQRIYDSFHDGDT
jgi:excinuclease ABC subunit C